MDAWMGAGFMIMIGFVYLAVMLMLTNRRIDEQNRRHNRDEGNHG